MVSVFQVIQNSSSVLPADVETDTSQHTMSAVATRLFQQRFWKKKEFPSALLLKCPLAESRATDEGAVLSKLFTMSQGEIRFEMRFLPLCFLLHSWEIPV